jgi:hypothetical protein
VITQTYPPLGLEFRADLLREVILPNLRVAVASPHRDPELEQVFVRTLDELARLEQRLETLRHVEEPQGGPHPCFYGRVGARSRALRVRARGQAPASSAWRALLRRSRRRVVTQPAPLT